MGEWVEVQVPTDQWDQLAALMPDAQMTYRGGAYDGQRTLHLWPQQPQGGPLAKLMLIEAASVRTVETVGQPGGSGDGVR